MKLSFRQGIARHQTDSNGNPTFLQKSATGQFIDLVISPDPTVIVFAHREGTYVVEELKTIHNAWGPITGSQTMYLYWDVNLLTGVLTRGITLLAPLYTSVSPVNPQVDQHWFDTVSNTMMVWNGSKWIEKVRCFAGYITSGSIIHPYKIGSQAGLVGNFEGGNIVLDSFGMPLRQSNGCFVTTVTWLNIVNLGTVTARLDSPLLSGLAAEELPKYSLIQLQPGRRMVLARSTDYRTRVSGIVVEDLYEGEISRVVSEGLVYNSDWSFADPQINKPIFCGGTGQITTTPPSTGSCQQVGFVYDRDCIFMDIQQPVILDDPNSIITPPPVVVPGLPTPSFSVDISAGVAPLVVTFTNNSSNASNYEWDFTNDGFVDTTTISPVYTFETPGIYTVRLRAINSTGSADSISTNLISVTAPVSGPLFVNLGVSIIAPPFISAGQNFNFQVKVTNDGAAPATNVVRTLIMRSNNGTEVALAGNPAGVSSTKSGPLTTVILPTVGIASGNFVIFNLTAVSDASATSIQLEGTAYSQEADPTPGDNKTTLTIGVRP